MNDPTRVAWEQIKKLEAELDEERNAADAEFKRAEKAEAEAKMYEVAYRGCEIALVKAEAERDALQAQLDEAVAQGHKSALRVLALEAVVEKARATRAAEEEWNCALSASTRDDIRAWNERIYKASADLDASYAAFFSALDALEVDRG